MADIIHRIGIKAPVAKVFNALTSVAGVAGWWTEETTGSAELGGVLTFTFKADDGSIKGKMVATVQTLEANRRVQWHLTDGPPDWIDTDLVFDLKQEGEHTIIQFAHKNWKEATESTAHCSMKWATFLLSLRALVETGKGSPAPHDLKIDNWN
ncbi:MAG: SRPBCC domain-containing protein [Proteobacteria bacterium]|nr:MAG: SRPBCC domain-containing protein [Pseudomonadota bacterium]